MVLDSYTYIFALGSCFALLEAYNNGANDVANAWATSVSSRSVTYRQAMVLCTIFELTGALAVGARTASTIKNGIIPSTAFGDNAGVQLLAFACSSAGAALWVMWCTRNSAHVSSTYSLVSSIAGVGVAAVGASKVQWGWSNGSGLGAIFAGLAMAPFISACFAAIIFMLIKVTVHMRKNPLPWAVWTSPAFFLIAGTVCTLSIVYKGSPRLGLDKRPGWWIASVSLGAGFGLCLLAAFFFVPYVHTKVVKKDQTVRWWMMIQGPLLFKRPAPPDAENLTAKVPDYSVIQAASDSDSDVTYAHKKNDSGSADDITPAAPVSAGDSEKGAGTPGMVEYTHAQYQQLLKDAEERHHANLRKTKGPLGWAMRTLHKNRLGAGSIHETHNLIAMVKRIPAMVIVALLYGTHYDIHTAQVGIHNSPEGRRMERVYSYAPKYPNEVEHLYSYVQVITACTASFAHGANDVGNAVGVWAGMYAAWSTGRPSASKAEVPLWQLGVTAAAICIGFITYGYNIMKVMGNKLTYHSPSRGSSMELGAAITILIFSQYSLPVSTSMCITGATVGVGLCNGTFKAVNWKRVGLLFFSWVMTVPIAGLIGGCLMGLAVNTPHW
ncbi:phosphate transporter [Achaetomium macrosporum]|uniref:Phosphate transporter n=1 Tax=Achaetomium macrosporum TaxID=79813 RepID=A0AAN7C4Y5_9PEZI|nr:phosphate transporter [Achaetomium macrosporum]